MTPHPNSSSSYYHLLLIFYLFIYFFIIREELRKKHSIKKKKSISKHVFYFICYKTHFFLTQQNVFFGLLRTKTIFLNSIPKHNSVSKNSKNCFSKTTTNTDALSFILTFSGLLICVYLFMVI